MIYANSSIYTLISNQNDFWVTRLVDPDELDSDADGILDINDNCPTDFNPDQLNTDNDNIGNVCDDDDDGDGVPDTEDAFPLDKNETLDTDNDGIGNNTDDDDDGDGYSDTEEAEAGTDSLDPNDTPRQSSTILKILPLLLEQ